MKLMDDYLIVLIFIAMKKKKLFRFDCPTNHLRFLSYPDQEKNMIRKIFADLM